MTQTTGGFTKLGILCALSVAGNLILGVAWLSASRQESQVDERGSPETKRPAAATVLASVNVPISDEVLRREVDQLKQRGLSEEQTMTIMLDRISRSLESSYPRNEKYWEANWQPGPAADLQTRAAFTQAVGDTLTRLFGATAENAPALASVFRPFDREYPFLAPAEQRALRDLRLRRQLARTSGAPGSGPASSPVVPGVLSPGTGGASLAGSSFIDELAAALPKEKALEVALRESSVAQRLRAANAGLTEEEFRKLFNVIAEADRAGRPATLRQLVPIVSKQTAVRVLAQSDPVWPKLVQASRDSRLSDDTLMAVYSLVRESADDLVGRVQAGVLSQENARLVAESISRRNERIRGLVGEETAARLLEAINSPLPGQLPPNMRPLQMTQPFRQ